MNGRMLTELGELEQNLVYGDMGSAELIKFLQGESEAVSLLWEGMSAAACGQSVLACRHCVSILWLGEGPC